MYISDRTLARYLDVSISWVRRQRRAGAFGVPLRARYGPGGHPVRLSTREVARWILANKWGSTASQKEIAEAQQEIWDFALTEEQHDDASRRNGHGERSR